MATGIPAARRVWVDPPSVASAGALVCASGAARGLGDWPTGGGVGVIVSIALALSLWLLASFLVATLGRYLAPGEVRFAPVLRTCALAAAPALLLALGVAPLPHPIATALWVGVHAAMTLAFVVAVREALAIDTMRALLLSVATLGLGLLVVLTLERWLAAPPSERL